MCLKCRTIADSHNGTENEYIAYRKGPHTRGVLSITHFKTLFYFQLKFISPITYSAMTTIGTKYLKIGFIQS